MPRKASEFARRLAALLRTRLGHLLVFAFSASLLLLAASVVVEHARMMARRLPCYRLTPSSVVFLDLPPYVDERMRLDLVRGIAASWPDERTSRPSTFDPSLDRR